MSDFESAGDLTDATQVEAHLVVRATGFQREDWFRLLDARNGQAMTPDEVVKTVIASKIGYDQVIREFDRWTHISVPNTPDTAPRRQALIIDKQGTRVYA